MAQDRVTLYRCGLQTDRVCACGRVARRLRRDGYAVTETRVAVRARDRDVIDALTGKRRVPVLVAGRDVVCDPRRIHEHLDWRRDGDAA